MIYDNQNGAFVGDFVFTKVPFVGSPKNTPWSREKNELRAACPNAPSDNVPLRKYEYDHDCHGRPFV